MAKATTPIASRGDARKNNEHDYSRRRGHIHVPSAVFVFGALCVLLCASAGLVIAPRAQAQIGVGGIDHAPPDDTQLQFVSSWGGAVNAVEVDETARLAYVGAGRRLVVVDVADESHPVEIGAVDMGNLVLDLEVKDGYAFVVTKGTGSTPFRVVDISDPTRPRIVASTTVSRTWQPTRIEIYGTLAYIIRKRDADNFFVYDISDPEEPVYLGVHDFVPDDTIDFVIEGDLLYDLAIGNSGGGNSMNWLRVYDLTGNRQNPPLLDELNLGTKNDISATTLDVEGEYALVLMNSRPTGDPDYFDVIDVSEPTDLRWVGRASGLWRATDVTIENGIAYVSDRANTNRDCDYNMLDWDLSKGLAIYDVWQNPTNPPLIATFKTHGATSHVEVFGDTAYTFDDGEGLVLVDVTLPIFPERLGHYHSPASLRMMDRLGDLLYVTDEWNGITILDVSSPSEPELVGVYQTPLAGRGDHWGIDVEGDYAYFSAGWSGPRVIDVSVPSAPALEAEVENWPDGVKVLAMEFDQMGDRLILHVGRRVWDCQSQVGYLTNYEVTDLGNGTRIQEVGSLSFGEPLAIRTTADGYAHVATYAHVVVDTTTPNDLREVGYHFPPDATDCERVGDLLYVADERTDTTGGMYIFNIAEPENVVFVGHFSARRGSAVAVAGNRAYLTGNADLYYLDVSDPAKPTELFMMDLPDTSSFYPNDIVTSGDYMFVSTGAGVQIFSPRRPVPPVTMQRR